MQFPESDPNNVEQEVMIGGNIGKSLAGKTQLSPLAIIKETFSAGRQTRLVFGLAGLVLLGILMTLTSVILPLINPEQQQLFLVALEILSAPLVAGLSMMGVNCALRIKIKVNQVFEQLKKAAALLHVGVITMLVPFVVMNLFAKLAVPVFILILLNILFYLLVQFSLLLVAERGLTALAALKLSIQVGVKYLLPLLLCNSITAVLASVGISPALGAIAAESTSVLPYLATALFIVFIVLPFHFTLRGILYRELFGVRVMMLDNPKSGTFGA